MKKILNRLFNNSPSPENTNTHSETNLNNSIPLEKENSKSSITYYGYEEGLNDGRIQGLDPKLGEEIIAGLNEVDYLNDKVSKIKEEAEKLSTNIAKAKQVKKEAHSSLSGIKGTIKSLTENIKSYAEELTTLKQEKHRITRLGREIYIPYPWLTALLMLLAGFIFIGADFYVAKNIVSYGFDLKDGWDSILFAAGIAGVAFIIKPFFDRVFEKEYEKGNNKKSNHIFLGISAFFALTTIVILGFFRSVALAIKLNINDEHIQETIDGQSLHWSGTLGLIFASVLFAVGGAIMLAIAIPALTRLWNKHVIINTQKIDIENSIKKLTTKKDKLNNSHSEYSEVEEKLNWEIKLCGDLDKMIDTYDGLMEELDLINQQIKTAKTKIGQNKYKINFAKSNIEVNKTYPKHQPSKFKSPKVKGNKISMQRQQQDDAYKMLREMIKSNIN